MTITTLIVAKSLYGIKFLTHYKVDACLPAVGTVPQTARPGLKSQRFGDSDTKTSYQGLGEKHFERKAFNSPVAVIPYGKFIPQQNLVCFRAEKKAYLKFINWRDESAFPFFSQVGEYHIPSHKDGEFDKVTKLKTQEGTLKKRFDMEFKFYRRFAAFLKQLIELVKDPAAPRNLALLHINGELTLHEHVDGPSILPDDHLALFRRHVEKSLSS